MTKTWDDLINEARGAGWKVAWREAVEGYVIITPKAPRRPSEELGHYTEERAAWRATANLHRLREAS
jgi:hypothetical protein